MDINYNIEKGRFGTTENKSNLTEVRSAKLNKKYKNIKKIGAGVAVW